MAKTILGVDIGYDNLKLALLKDSEVKKTVTVPMPKNMVRDGKVVSGEAMAEMLRDTMKENGIRTGDAAFVIPNERAYVKTVTLPVMTADQLAYNLPFEFRDYITGEIRDFLFDYAMISGSDEKQEKKSFLSSIFGGGSKKKDKKSGKKGKKGSFEEDTEQSLSGPGSSGGPSQGGFAGGFGGALSGGAGQGNEEDGEEEKKPKQMELLAVSVPRAEIESARDILRKAGLKLTKAAPSLCAYINLIRLFEKNAEKDAGEHYEEYCILDLGYQSIRLHMFHGDRHMVTRVLDMGLSSLDSVISEAYGADIHLAHTYILTNYDNCQEREECIQAYDNIAMELMRVMNFYRYSNPDSNITDMWLCGGGASIPPLREAISVTLGLDIHPASDLIPGGEEIEDANSFVQAIGIAVG